MNFSREYLFCMLIYSAMFLFINFATINIAEADEISYNELHDAGFWDKFKDSVNRDRDDPHEPNDSSRDNDSPSHDGGRGHGGPNGHGGHGGADPRMAIILPR